MPSKIPVGKRQLNVLINEELYSKLVAAATSRYGRVHGALSATVEEALTVYFEYLEKEGVGGGDTSPPRAHTQSTQNYTFGSSISVHKVRRAFFRVLDFIRRLHNYQDEVICEVTERELVAAIREVIGVDPRTVKKYISLFQEHGLIRHDRGFSKVYKVLTYSRCLE